MKDMKLFYLKNTIENDSALDEKTGHMFREVNGDITEYKFCVRCKEWHPITEFVKCSKSADGLQSYCKKCVARCKRESYWRKKGQAIIEPIETPKTFVEPEVTEAKTQSSHETIEGMIASLKEAEEQKERVIAGLQAENAALKKQSKNLDALNESDIKRVLANAKIPLRLLFEAIANRTDDRFRFFAYDREIGMNIPIKTQERAEQPFSRSA